MSYVAVVGSRSLPASWASRVDSVVGSLLARGRFVGSGGAVGADLFALRSLVRRGRSACSGSVVFLPGELGSAPSSCVSWLSRFVRLGGRVVVGPAPARASRRDFVSALFARSRSLVSGSSGVVAFVSGRSAGSWFSVASAAELGLPVVVFPVEGPRALRSLGAGRWVRLRCWAGAFRWVPARLDKERCIHGLIGSYCALCQKGGPPCEIPQSGSPKRSGLFHRVNHETQSDLYLSSSEINPPYFWRVNSSADPYDEDRTRKEEVMETLRSLYDHSDYGEAYDAMARHVSEMPGLDRIIFEDCDLVSGKVAAPHMNLKPYPHWLCPEYAARKIGCDLQDAVNLLDCWVILDPTQEMVETFISWVKVRGVENASPYFEKLAISLAEVENIDPDDVTESDEPKYEAPDLYRYHTVGEYEEDEDKAWMEIQPGWYQSLIRKVQNSMDLDNLASMGRDVYQRNLNRGQAGVFWTEYNLQKSKLERDIKLGPVARSMMQRIAKANGNLASLGAWLYKVQQGQINVANPPEKHEWTIIWRTYHEQKLEHNPAQLSLY